MLTAAVLQVLQLAFVKEAVLAGAAAKPRLLAAITLLHFQLNQTTAQLSELSGDPSKEAEDALDQARTECKPRGAECLLVECVSLLQCKKCRQSYMQRKTNCESQRLSYANWTNSIQKQL